MSSGRNNGYRDDASSSSSIGSSKRISSARRGHRPRSSSYRISTIDEERGDDNDDGYANESHSQYNVQTEFRDDTDSFTTRSRRKTAVADDDDSSHFSSSHSSCSKNTNMSFWSTLSVKTAMAVMKANGSENVANTAANAVLDAEKARHSTSSLSKLAIEVSIAVLQAGGDQEAAAAASYAIMNGGQDLSKSTNQKSSKFSSNGSRKKSMSDADSISYKTSSMAAKRRDLKIREEEIAQKAKELEEAERLTCEKERQLQEKLAKVTEMKAEKKARAKKAKAEKAKEAWIKPTSSGGLNCLYPSLDMYSQGSGGDGSSKIDEENSRVSYQSSRARSSNTSSTISKQRELMGADALSPSTSTLESTLDVISTHSLKAKRKQLKIKEEEMIMKNKEMEAVAQLMSDRQLQIEQQIMRRFEALEAAEAALQQKTKNIELHTERMAARTQWQQSGRHVTEADLQGRYKATGNPSVAPRTSGNDTNSANESNGNSNSNQWLYSYFGSPATQYTSSKPPSTEFQTLPNNIMGSYSTNASASTAEVTNRTDDVSRAMSKQTAISALNWEPGAFTRSNREHPSIIERGDHGILSGLTEEDAGNINQGVNNSNPRIQGSSNNVNNNGDVTKHMLNQALHAAMNQHLTSFVAGPTDAATTERSVDNATQNFTLSSGATIGAATIGATTTSSGKSKWTKRRLGMFSFARKAEKPVEVDKKKYLV